MYVCIHIHIYIERERESSRVALRTCCSQQQVCWVDVPSSGGRLESYAEAAGLQLPPQVSLAKSKPEIAPFL